MSDLDDVQIITPPVADETDLLDHGLVTLTQAIGMIDPDAVAHGLLGGDFGYGARFENAIFMIHPYCWCEKPDCLWCCIWLSNETDCTEQEAEAHREKQTAEVRAKYGDWAAQHPGAPHFWHKPSGLQVRWYKWIGRCMEMNNPTHADIATVMRECVESLAPKSARRDD